MIKIKLFMKPLIMRRKRERYLKWISLCIRQFIIKSCWNNENVIESKITLFRRARLFFASPFAFQKPSCLKFLSQPPRYVGWIRKILGALKNKRIHRFRYLFRSRPLGNHTTKVSAPHFFREIMEYRCTRFCTLTTSAPSLHLFYYR